MGSGIDVKKMIEDGRDFDRLYAGLRDSDDSGDEYMETLSSMKREAEAKQENNASCSVPSTSVEPKGENISFDSTFLDMSTVGCSETVQEKRRNTLVEEIMKKAVLPDFESRESIPPYEVSKRKLLREKMKKRESTKGEDWFNMRAPEVTEELKNELEVLKMRAVLDTKQFYKKNALKTLPKYFQVGTIVESPADFYSSRIPKKQRKQTMVEELLADAEFQRQNKQRFKEIIEERRRARRRGNKNKNKNKNKK